MKRIGFQLVLTVVLTMVLASLSGASAAVITAGLEAQMKDLRGSDEIKVLDSILWMLKSILTESRDISRGSQIKSNLPGALIETTEMIETVFGIKCNINNIENTVINNTFVTTNIYYIINEAINNATASVGETSGRSGSRSVKKKKKRKRIIPVNRPMVLRLSNIKNQL